MVCLSPSRTNGLPVYSGLTKAVVAVTPDCALSHDLANSPRYYAAWPVERAQAMDREEALLHWCNCHLVVGMLSSSLLAMSVASSFTIPSALSSTRSAVIASLSTGTSAASAAPGRPASAACMSRAAA